MKRRKKPHLRLAQVLKEKGISKYRFAKLLGHQSNANVLSYYKKDYNPTFATLVKWAEALDCKVRDLIDE